MRDAAVLLPHPPSLFLFYESYFYLNSGIAEAERKITTRQVLITPTSWQPCFDYFQAW